MVYPLALMEVASFSKKKLPNEELFLLKIERTAGMRITKKPKPFAADIILNSLS